MHQQQHHWLGRANVKVESFQGRSICNEGGREGALGDGGAIRGW